MHAAQAQGQVPWWGMLFCLGYSMRAKLMGRIKTVVPSLEQGWVENSQPPSTTLISLLQDMCKVLEINKTEA